MKLDWKATILATCFLLLLSVLVNLAFAALSFPVVAPGVDRRRRIVVNDQHTAPAQPDTEPAAGPEKTREVLRALPSR